MKVCSVFGGFRCQRWDCPSCGPLKRGDQQRVLLRNLIAAECNVWLLTVTAPGDDVLPRDDAGICEWSALADWCESRPDRWRHLRKALSGRPSLRPSPILATVWQAQRRGAPHAHLVVEGTDRGYLFALVLDSLAERYGFGHVDLAGAPGWRHKRPKPWAPYLAAKYLSRYLEAATGPWSLDQWRSLMPGTPFVKVHPVLSRATWDTLGNLRLVRHLYVHVHQGASKPRFRSDRHATVIYRKLTKKPLDYGVPLSEFSDEPYAETRPSFEREVEEARRVAALKRGEIPGQIRLKFV